MPPIFLHMAMARDVRERLAALVTAEHPGAYYLGASSPDIRVITRWERARTHFFDLSDLGHQDSVATMFLHHPDLADAGRLPPPAAAFVAGYIGHLALDETWITTVYRPHFGQQSALGGNTRANLMDRLLQYELDRRRREAPEHAAEIRTALEGCSLACDVGFLDSATLRRWLEVAIDVTRHPPDYEMFLLQLRRRRHFAPGESPSERDLIETVEQIPEVLETTLRHVSTAHVDAYLEQATERAVAAAARYLEIAEP